MTNIWNLLNSYQVGLNIEGPYQSVYNVPVLGCLLGNLPQVLLGVFVNKGPSCFQHGENPSVRDIAL